MNFQIYYSNFICIVVALVTLLWLLRFAKFYAPSYFFWIGTILTVLGAISLFHPLEFLFIFNRIVALLIVLGGILISIISLIYPVHIKHSPIANQKIDTIIPDFAFNEFHKVHINASIEKVKHVLQIIGVKDIPIAHLLMKIRGIADEDIDIKDKASNTIVGKKTISTPDFNFFIVAPDEWITVMILKSAIVFNNANIPAPPEISTLEQFQSFNEPGYVKVTVNFRFIRIDNNKTILTTETRNNGTSLKDNRTFGYYWRIIYPGSAIIRRVWLNAIKKKAED